MRTLQIGICCLILIACGDAGSSRLVVTRETSLVESSFNGWITALNSRDNAAIASFYVQSDSLHMVWPQGETNRGWDAEARFHREVLGSLEAFNLVPNDMNVSFVRPDLAVVTFRFSLDELTATQRWLGPGHGLTLWYRDNRTYQLIAGLISLDSRRASRVGS